MNIREMIRDEAGRRGITISRLCKEASVPKEGIFRYLNNPDVSIHSDNMIKMIYFCGYEIVKGKR